MQTKQYIPPPTVDAFIQDYKPNELFYDWIVGPYGSGKTTGLFMKLCYMAGLQKRGPDGVRRSRCAIVRNTKPQLRDTTIKSWLQWFQPDIAGRWTSTDANFLLKVGDIECEVMFRALDTPDDISRVLSLDLTFAIIDEFREVPEEIIEALAARLGRYPAEIDGGCTNYGMWGASNPGTEDVWWFDFIHNMNKYAPGEEKHANVQLIELFGPRKRTSSMALMQPSPQMRYFHQPPGDSAEAENLDNLPDGYYTNLMKGRATAWIEQYVRANWGFSASETPVVSSFIPALHVAKQGLLFSHHYKLVIGLDPGIQGTAAVFGQEDIYGRLLVLGELFVKNYGATRFADTRMKPYLRQRFPGADLIIAPDPAAANRQPGDEKTVVDALKKAFGPGVIQIETNNRLAKRLDAIEAYSTNLCELGPSLLIDPIACPMLVRALGGGWKYQKMARSSESNKPDPEKNDYSHIGDAFGYLCRYYQRQFERFGQRGMLTTRLPNQAQRLISTNPNYHMG